MTPGLPQQGYERFFGFREPPFSLAPNPRFLFESGSHTAVLAQVGYVLERREPLVVVTGEIGTGKTLLCRTVLERAERKTFISVINDPLLEREDLLKQILQDFGVISRDRAKLAATGRHELIRALEEFLASLVPLQAHAVVIVDEAQQVHPEVLEQIRLLSNLDSERGTMLQVILVGQADLEPLLARPELRQLEQRVSRRLRLEPLNAGEVEQYVNHRIAVARTAPAGADSRGADADAEAGDVAAGPEFTRDAFDAIAAISGGVPRVINILCDRALEGAYARLSHTVDAGLIDETARELNLSVPEPQSAGSMWTLPERTSAPELPAIPAIENLPDVTASPPSPVGMGAVESGETPGEPALAAAASAPPPAKPQARRHVLVFALSAIAAAVATWFGARALMTPSSEPSPRPAATSPARPTPAQPAPNRPVEQPSAPPPTAGPMTSAPTTPAPTTTAPTTTAPTTPAPTPSAPKQTSGGESSSVASKPPSAPSQNRPAASGTAAAAGDRFDIIVASFRTEARAASVAADVKALGLPVTVRATGGWQQVLVGPFASRPAADDAQRRLGAAGLSGTQVVTSAR